MLSEAPRRCPAAILGAAGAMLGVAGGAAPPCWVWRAGWGGGTAANGGHRARPQQAGGSGGLRALQRRDPTGLSRHCTAWHGGVGGEAVGHTGESPGQPPCSAPSPAAAPRHGEPQPGWAAGAGTKSVNTESVNTTSTHTLLGHETGRGASNPTVCLQPQLPPCWAPTACSPPWAQPSREEVEAMGSRPAARHHGCGALHCASSPSATVPAGIGSPPRVPSCSTRAPGGPAAAPRRHPPSPSLASWWGRASPVLQPHAPGPGLWGAGIQEAPKPPSVAARSTWAPHRPSLRAVGGPLCPQGPNRFLRG